MKVLLPITDENVGKRLDVYLSEALEMSRSAAQSLAVTDKVGTVLSKNYKLRKGDELSVDIPEPKQLEAVPQDIPVDIVYEDDWLLVVDKPQGMVVHPAAGNEDGTLVNALLYKCEGRLSSINGVIRPGIVHRIDKDTSGLLIVAKCDESHSSLAEQIAEHSFTRKYETVVVGNIKDDEGTVDAPIGRHKTDRKKMCVRADNSRNAVTHYRVIERYRGYTRLELTLETGRTHQIRVHMKHIGHPVVGDPVYGSEKNEFGLKGQCLTAKYIKFVHPITNETLEFEAELPEFFTKTLDKLEKQYKIKT